MDPEAGSKGTFPTARWDTHIPTEAVTNQAKVAREILG